MVNTIWFRVDLIRFRKKILCVRVRSDDIQLSERRTSLGTMWANWGPLLKPLEHDSAMVWRASSGALNWSHYAERRDIFLSYELMQDVQCSYCCHNKKLVKASLIRMTFKMWVFSKLRRSFKNRKEIHILLHSEKGNSGFCSIRHDMVKL